MNRDNYQLGMRFKRLRVPGHAARRSKRACDCGWIATGLTRRERQREYTEHLNAVAREPFRTCKKCRHKKGPAEMSERAPAVCKNCEATRVRRWALEHPDISTYQKRKWYLKKQFGITPEEFDQIFESQGRGCAICENKKADADRAFHLDHDHKTGQIRGLLCGRCNRAIGQFSDSIDLLLKAVSYLRRYQNVVP